MSDSWARNSRLVNSTSTMPVQLTKLVMSASVTVRPIVLNCRPTGRSSKQNPRPTVSILSSTLMLRCKHTIRQTRAVPILRNRSNNSCHTDDGGGNPIGVGEYAGDFDTLPLDKEKWQTGHSGPGPWGHPGMTPCSRGYRRNHPKCH